MNILSHFNEKMKKTFYEHFSKYNFNISRTMKNPYTIDSYEQFVTDFDKFGNELMKAMYISVFEQIDNEFFLSNERIGRYASKGFVSRTLITMFGEITFRRRRYIDNTGKSYMHVDRFLGLEKYKSLDPLVIGFLVSKSAETSYADAARCLSDMIGRKIKYDDDVYKDIISRATARNNVLTAEKDISEYIRKLESIIYNVKEVEELTITLDEIFVSSQTKNKDVHDDDESENKNEKKEKDFMVKAGVVFEKTERISKNRNSLVGKKSFATINGNLETILMDYIYYNYNTDKLKRINIMGDGAGWIKSIATGSAFKFHKDLEVLYGLDHFHVAQALIKLTTKKHEDVYDDLYNQLLEDNKEEFKNICADFLKENQHREKMIEEKKDYILNNWKYVMNSLHNIDAKCSMESDISHTYASLLASRPKGFSLESLESLLNLRLFKVNGYDLKKCYLNALKEKEKVKKETEMENKFIVKNKKYDDELYTSVPTMHSSDITSQTIRNMINHGGYVI